MSTGDELLRAIAERPDDVPLRLVYADWLEETGDIDRAAFVRAQVAAGPDNDSCWDHPPGWEEADRLWQRHKRAWLAELPSWVRQGAYFEGGVPTGAPCTARQFLRHAPRLFARVPTLRRFHFQADSGRWGQLAACPALGEVRSLTAIVDGEDVLGHLIASGRVAQLDRLGLYVAGLCRPPRVGWKDPDWPAAFPALRRLALDDSRQGRHAAAALARGGLPRLTHLSLECCRLRADDAAALLARPLTRLDLGGNPLRDEFAEALAAHGPPSLQELDLSNTGLTTRGVEALTGGAWVGRLRSLALDWNRIGPQAVIALLRSPRLASLRDLDVNHTNLTAAGLRRVFAEPGLMRLRKLGLYGLTPLLDAEGVRAIAGSPYAANLEALDLSGAEWGDGGAEALAASLHLGHLRGLRADATRLTRRGGAARPCCGASRSPGSEPADPHPACRIGPHLTRPLSRILLPFHLLRLQLRVGTRDACPPPSP
jgi:uncharacterized protein (TIGR02996 family)